MSRSSMGLDERLHAYMLSVSRGEPEALRRLREETARRDDAEMQIAPEQARLMALLVKAIGARRTLELGVFTGYSAASVALALPEGGRVVACEVDPEVAEIARGWWREIGIEDRIDLRVAPALETLDALLAGGEAGAFDFAFIDADKREYLDYWERCVQLVRPGGLIAVDNVFRRGTVADPTDADPYAVATRAFNARVRDDDRVDLAIVPIADGVTLALVR